MKQSIWKFALPMDGDAKITMPEGAKVLCVDTQGGQPFIWAICNTEAATAPRHFKVLGTGHPFKLTNPDEFPYIGTFQLNDGALIFHLFGGKE